MNSNADVELWESDDSERGEPMTVFTQASVKKGQTQSESSSTAKTSVIQFVGFVTTFLSTVTFPLA